MKTSKLKLFSILTLTFVVLLTGCKKAPKVSEVDPAVKPAWKVDEPDPKKSFFKDQVKYPYKAKYCMAKDSKGVNWKIGYMDIQPKGIKNPPVIVMIHGKGAYAGYFGHTMWKAVQAGFRVIAPDLPFYGKSLPPNLDKNISRTMQHTREAIHDLVVNKLGVKKAVYLGHSLGGQWVLGFALTYPDAVTKIILEAPGGLETFVAPLFSPKMMDDIEKWKKNPIYAGLLKKEIAKTPEAVKLFYYFKAKNDKGEVVDSPFGYFKNDTEYTKFITQVCVKMIKGNQKEYKAYCVTYVRDIYTLGLEMFPKNPMYIYDKYPKIKAPIFLAFGEAEPFIPTKLSGKMKQGLKKGIILPFYKAMKAAGNTPVVKMYPGTGHFVHTDVPDEFAADSIMFAKSNQVDGATSDADVMAWENIPNKE